MGVFHVNGPNGEVYEVTAPDGATQAQIVAFAQQQAASTPPPAQPGLLDKIKGAATQAFGDLSKDAQRYYKAASTPTLPSSPLELIPGFSPQEKAAGSAIQDAAAYVTSPLAAVQDALVTQPLANAADHIPLQAYAPPTVSMNPGGISLNPARALSPEETHAANADSINTAMLALGADAAPAASAEAVAAVPKPRGAVGQAAATMRAGASQAVAEQEAARVLAARASDPKAVAAALERNGEIVPGSQPTTFQQTGDMGLGELEREQATKNPSAFRQRSTEQNKARSEALGDIQQGADPNDVAKTLKSQFDDLDLQTQADVDAATTKAQADHDAAAAKAQAAYGETDAQTQATVDAATGQAQQHTAAIGGVGVPEAYGETLRGAVDQAEQGARARERALWDAVDPNGDLTGNVAHTARAADDIQAKMSPTAKPMSGEEAGIFEAAQNMPHLSPVTDLIDLRSRVNDAMSTELRTDGRTVSYARLAKLRGAIQENLATTIAHQISQEDALVARGTVNGEDTILSRLQDWENAWRTQRSGGGVDSALPDTGGPTSRGASQDGAGLPQSGGSGGFAGDQGLSPGAVETEAPTFDAEAKGRLDQATAATKERARTFGASPVDSVTARNGASDLFKLPDGQVPGKFFHPGPKAFSDIQALVKAAGEQVIPTLVDYAAMSLRRAAELADGTLDPMRFTRWRVAHADALRALPADARSRFANAAVSTQTLRETEAARSAALRSAETTRKGELKTAEATRDSEVRAAQAARAVTLKNAQSGAIGKVMGLSEPEDVVKTVGQILNGRTAVADMRSLAKATASDPAARAGLRQAVADHVTRTLIGNAEAGTSGVATISSDKFQTFIKNAAPALHLIFKPDEVNLMKAIAADLQRSARSANAIKLPGSNTAQDLTALRRSGTMQGARTFLDAIAAGVGSLHGPFGAVAGVMGSEVIQGLHAAGVSRIDQLVTEAMLHPQVARRLLQKLPVGKPQNAALKAIGMGLGRALRSTQAAAWAQQMDGQRPS